MANKTSRLVGVGVLAGLLTLGACTTSSNDNPAISGNGSGAGGVGQSADVTMAAVNGGQSGTATLLESPSLQLTVSITLANPSVAQEPAAIHAGTCSSINPIAKFPLSPVIHGKSTTDVANTTLGELESTPYVIVVQRNGTSNATISCGLIPQAAPSPAGT